MSRVLLLLVLASAASGGCAAMTNPVAAGVPVNRVPPEILGRPKADLRPIPLTLLRQRPPAQYRLDRGDVLAVVAEDVLGPANQMAPVRMPDETNAAAAIGYPIPVLDDGTISLPRVPPIPVRGKTVWEAEQLVLAAVVKAELVKPAAARVSVQLLQRRRYRVTVVREDSQGTAAVSTLTSSLGVPVATPGGIKKGAGFNLNLFAYENDVLHALNATGGLPGLDAKNEVLIYRSGDNPAGTVVRIPLRVYPDEPISIAPGDVILNDGDVVSIEARETEVYYTAGLVGGGQFPLPRDYDLDVIQAIAQVRGPLLNGGFSQNAFVAQSVNSGIGNPSPSLCTVLRPLPNQQQLAIRVNLNKAFRDRRERILIRPGDILVLQERPGEAIARYFSETFRFSNLYIFSQNGHATSTLTATNP